MPINIKTGTGIVEIDRVFAKTVSNTISEISAGYVKTSNTQWSLFYNSLITVTINEPTLNVDLFKLCGSPRGKVNVILYNNSNIGSDASTEAALKILGFHPKTIITIINKGYIVGKGGNGNPWSTAGDVGGDAIHTSVSLVIDNTGTIGGGGGGGASSHGQYALAGSGAVGGAGAGYTIGTGGGGVATITKGGSGQYVQIYLAAYVQAGTGGDLGKDGGFGWGNAIDGNSAVGVAGSAILKNPDNTITYLTTGTILGNINDN